jgi:hypothetical protein
MREYHLDELIARHAHLTGTCCGSWRCRSEPNAAAPTLWSRHRALDRARRGDQRGAIAASAELAGAAERRHELHRGLAAARRADYVSPPPCFRDRQLRREMKIMSTASLEVAEPGRG